MFSSFYMAGFEGATGYNRRRQWFDQIARTGHERSAALDYALIGAAGLKTARECIRWPVVDLGNGRFDFSSVEPMVSAARNAGVEVIWDLFHFGYPCDCDLLNQEFIERFSAYCRAAVRFLASRHDGPLYITPINEPSYFAFAAGEQALFFPHMTGTSGAIKVVLARAALAGMTAMRKQVPHVKFVNVDPVCHVVAPVGRPDLEREAHAFNTEHVYETWDMLAGNLRPELGGSPDLLDIVGVNYYWTNQWQIGSARGASGVAPPLADDDLRRKSLAELLVDVAQRYDRDIVVTETSHFGHGRATWIRTIGNEVRAALAAGVPLKGVCFYPIMGMWDWHEPNRWLPMGLWDIDANDANLRRVIHQPMREALDAVMRDFETL
jgi:beta-glucosidase/6-phospho-beta-glucosidase/beta-galactosidase